MIFLKPCQTETISAERREKVPKIIGFLRVPLNRTHPDTHPNPSPFAPISGSAFSLSSTLTCGSVIGRRLRFFRVDQVCCLSLLRPGPDE